jgi:alkylmercury lyase
MAKRVGQRVHPRHSDQEAKASPLAEPRGSRQENTKEKHMNMENSSVEHLAIAIADSNSWERMTYSLPLNRLLAKGEPVSREQLATALNRPVAEVTEALRQLEDIVYDEEGRVVSAGLSLQPTPHQFEVNGHLLYTWCALDTLIFPVSLGRSAQVSSACPATGTPIHLTVTPERLEHLDPPSGVMSLLIQDGLATCGNIREAFCAYSLFFASREAAAPWLSQHPDGHVLPIEEAFTLGQKLAKLTMQRLQDGER